MQNGRHVILGGNLLVHPRIVIVEFLGMEIGCCLLPIVTWPISPSFLRKDGWTFFSQVSQFTGGRLDVLIVMQGSTGVESLKYLFI